MVERPYTGHNETLAFDKELAPSFQHILCISLDFQIIYSQFKLINYITVIYMFSR